MTGYTRLPAGMAATVAGRGGVVSGFLVRGWAKAAPAATPPVAQPFTILPTPPAGATKLVGDISLIAFPGHSYPESVSVINYARITAKFWLYAADAYTIRKGGGFAVQSLGSQPKDVGTWVSKLPGVITIPGRKQAEHSLHDQGADQRDPRPARRRHRGRGDD